MTAPWSSIRPEAPREQLSAALDELREIIGHAGKAAAPPAVARAEAGPDSGVGRITQRFALSGFERDLLLLCAGMELDADFAGFCRSAAGGEPTFGFALAALPDPHWSAITPTGPLRYWRLIELRPHEALTTAPLRVDERILHYIAGVSHLDERLHGIIRQAPSADGLAPGQRDAAAQIAALWAGAGQRREPWPPVQILGEDDAGAAQAAAAACAAHGLDLHLMRARDLPLAVADRTAFERLWVREAALADSGLLVETTDADGPEILRAAAAFAGQTRAVVLVSGREPLRSDGRPLARIDLAKPRRAHQADLWRQALAPGLEGSSADAAVLDAEIERVVSHFDLSAAAISGAAALACGSEADPAAIARRLWDSCRRQSRGRLDDLAQRVEATAGWSDLVLPPEQTDILREIVANVRQRARVYDHWGFAGKSGRGLGVSALFSGTSGTGKTLAAEIMAHELQLDLFRIDLSQVVSKYIGETEKNLRRVFDAAEAAGSVLLFDEADALFGKRSEVKDSHDRYANLEVSYLLQRMEAYRGLAVLTTNLPQAVDPAFKRRLRFIVQFPFPDVAERTEIWRRVFPAATPTEALDLGQLAQLNVAGGNIRNIALGAAFLAADAGAAVTMSHVLRAARAEYAKIGRTLTGAELGGWSV